MKWHTEKVRLGDLKEWEKNPRQLSTHDAEHINISISKFGLADPLVVNADHSLIGGHQRKRVMLMNGYTVDSLVDVRVPDVQLTEREAEELAIRLNKNSGNWDWDTLANEFEMDDLMDWGFSTEELEGLDFGDEPVEDVEPQIDRAEELREKWGVETGQLWKLGEHRLICGDCTDKAVVERVMGGEKAVMTFIDPPYNALKSWNKDEAKGETRLDPSKWFENDNMEWDDYWLLIERIFESLKGHSVYVCCDYRIYPGIRDKVERAGYDIKHCIVWVKNVWGLGKRYRFQHEFIVYACKEGAPFCGGRDQSDVWEVDVDRAGKHNTPKPIELSKIAIRNSSQVKELVYDGCLGSGTTLIACEQLNRKCRAIEISPAYCAVAIQRWVDVTGGEPELVL